MRRREARVSTGTCLRGARATGDGRQSTGYTQRSLSYLSFPGTSCTCRPRVLLRVRPSLAPDDGAKGRRKRLYQYCYQVRYSHTARRAIAAPLRPSTLQNRCICLFPCALRACSCAIGGRGDVG